MRFGIYPGGRAGPVSARPDDRVAVDALVGELAGGRPFAVREYVHFFDAATPPDVITSLGADHGLDHLTMPDEWYAAAGRELDLVVSYLPRRADVPGWLRFLDEVVDRYGHLARCLQVTLEPNFPIPFIDGSSPGVLDALTAGVPHARAAVRRRGLDARIGFSVAEPAEWLGGDDAFWAHLSALPHRDFAAHVDYVGLGTYPDAFSPVAPGGTASLIAHALRHLRENSLPRAGIPADVPVHVAENGSPSGAHRDEQGQCDSLTDMVTTTLELAEELNITQYELFSLRDADSASLDPIGSLGLVTDAYERKPAFDVYRGLIR
ncbi:hypothetical protein [Saccharothrix obliqua]|uniref:hypothetical protein n=1 Tax=Saccharothrix obliqua TaxID=2861747 RepID=UPI001C5F91DD|nr:hypothetical protein [Saccharothrix obliqua]MBW4721976.1 hypothetical protein [Saccharothrix obliqua]